MKNILIFFGRVYGFTFSIGAIFLLISAFLNCWEEFHNFIFCFQPVFILGVAYHFALFMTSFLLNERWAKKAYSFLMGISFFVFVVGRSIIDGHLYCPGFLSLTYPLIPNFLTELLK